MYQALLAILLILSVILIVVIFIQPAKTSLATSLTLLVVPYLNVQRPVVLKR